MSPQSGDPFDSLRSADRSNFSPEEAGTRQGANLRVSTPMRARVRTSSPHEALARERRRFERLLLARMGTTITREDAEDIVSEALLRAQRKLETDPPRRGSEGAWFARIVINQGVDFLRARDGRPRNGEPARPRPVELEEASGEPDRSDAAAAAEDGLTFLGDQAERDRARELVHRVMDAMDPKDAELVKLRQLTASHATRAEVAAMAGMTLGQFRNPLRPGLVAVRRGHRARGANRSMPAHPSAPWRARCRYRTRRGRSRDRRAHHRLPELPRLRQGELPGARVDAVRSGRWLRGTVVAAHQRLVGSHRTRGGGGCRDGGRWGWILGHDRRWGARRGGESRRNLLHSDRSDRRSVRRSGHRRSGSRQAGEDRGTQARPGRAKAAAFANPDRGSCRAYANADAGTDAYP